MNAPERNIGTVTVPAQRLDKLPIEIIAFSRTAAQQRRRARLTDESLADLAATIAEVGVLEPILVRVNTDGTGQYELVAGERRLRAAQLAGLTEIPAIVRDLTDAQVLRLQLIENLQRDNLDPLEEAEGYRELMRIENLNADAIGQLIGKSRSYVYARTKLLDLSPEAATALTEGDIDASKALLIARFKSAKLQKAALGLLRNGHYSFRHLARSVRERLTIKLDPAVFNPADPVIGANPTLTKAERAVGHFPGSCLTCPHSSGTDPELRAALNLGEGDRDVCTHTDCFNLKAKVATEDRIREWRDKGRPVLEGDAAYRAIPPAHWWSGAHTGYIDLDTPPGLDFPEPEPDDETEITEAYKAWRAREDAFEERTWAEHLGDTLDDDDITLAIDNKGRPRRLLPTAQAVAGLQRLNIDPGVWSDRINIGIGASTDEHDAIEDVEARIAREAREAKARAREQRRIQIERATRLALFNAIAGKWKASPLKHPELVHIAQLMHEESSYEAHAAVRTAIGRDPDAALNLDKLKDTELVQIIALHTIAEEATDLGGRQAGGALLDMAKRFRIDPAKVKKIAQAEIEAAEKAAKAGDAQGEE